MNAGKTAFIRSISEGEPVSTEKIHGKKEIPAVDFGRIVVDEETTVHLLGVPGQDIGFVWEIVLEGILGYVIVVDSADSDRLADTRNILNSFGMLHVPFVVAANKQDKQEALSVIEIRKRLFLEEKVRVLPCVAKNRESVKKVLLSLLHEVMELLRE